MALDTTYTSATYNAFTTILEMDAAMAELGLFFKNTFWAALTDIDKEALIKVASREVSKLDWQGTPTQGILVSSLTWPRTDVPNVGTEEIPYDLQLRMGCWVIHNSLASPLASDTANVKSKSVGDVSVTYDTSGKVNAFSPCDGYAAEYLMPSSYLGGLGTVGMRRNP